MRTKNAKSISKDEGAYLGLVKRLPCSVCDAPGPSDAHHVVQGLHFLAVALCKECHLGPINGWHGQKAMWRVMKMDMNDALAVTVRRVMEIVGLPRRVAREVEWN